MAIPTFRDLMEEIGERLRTEGCLGAILVDLGPLARIERGYGGAAFRTLRQAVDPILESARERFRQDDVLTTDENEGDRFILFVGGHRDGRRSYSAQGLQHLAERFEEQVAPRISRLTTPYFRERPTIGCGYAFTIFSPIESEERQILRLIADAQESAELRRRLRERAERERLLEIIQNRDIWTAFQPIVELGTRHPIGWEGLSRGPRGSDLELPLVLFGRAARYGLTEELERSCRRQAFTDWQAFGSPGRLFMNTVPATIRDTSFLGRGVFDYLGQDLPPRLVTLEITERQVIENLNLYRDAMHSFIELGFSFAIDDVGAGYSGLETVATLRPSYLKIDMSLVRDVHQKTVSQQVVKAILDLGVGIGATVIAEGIQTEEEAAVLVDLGVPLGQGYLYGRPADPYATRRVSETA
jgi:EAL domain-containing protein (putative c-di-GMP-specific phosphodiesterase class I)